MPQSRAALFLLLLLTLAARPAHAAGGAKWALLVGISKYEHPAVTPLQYAVRDVRAVADALVKHAGFKREQVITLDSDAANPELQPTTDKVIERLELLATQVRPEDTFLFYFSGHGFVRDGRTFLATTRTNPTTLGTLEVSALAAESLARSMGQVAARRRITVFDCCRNDPRSAKGDGDNLRTLELTRDLKQIAGAGPANVDGRATLYACRLGERALEWPEKEQGIFTYYLLEGLRGGAVDAGGEVTVQSLCAYLQREVPKCAYLRLMKRSQTPDFELQGDARMVLAQVAPSPAKPVPAAASAPSIVVRVRVESTPPGAQILVAGKALAGKVTPAEIPVAVGEGLRQTVVSIGVALAGYAPASREVTVLRDPAGSEPGSRLAAEVRFGLTRLAESMPSPAVAGGTTGQGRLGTFGSRTSMVSLISTPQVQQELKLDAAQVERVKGLADAVRQPLERPAGERAKELAAAEKAIEEVLDSRQRLRFKQLSLQLAGYRALEKLEIADQLRLSPEQRKQVESLLSQERDELRSLFLDASAIQDPAQRQALFQKLQQQRTQTNERLRAVLTDTQRREWGVLIGAPFTFPAARRSDGSP